MKLKFNKPHRSISQLKDIEINDFAVITGLNGTGKTHLLHAIEEGSIQIDEVPPSEIVYYNYNDFNVDYNQQPKSDQYSTVKKHANKNGNNIVQNVIRERNLILTGVDFLQNTEFDNLVESVLSNGHQLSILDWDDVAIESFNKYLQLNQDYDLNWQKLQSFPENIRTFIDNYGSPNIGLLKNNFRKNITNYFHKSLIKNIGFNPDLISWSKNDEEKYVNLKSQNPNLNIWDHEVEFAQYFLTFIGVYTEIITQFQGYVDEDLSTTQSELAAIFERLEVVLKDKLKPEYLRFLKSFSMSDSLCSHLQAESGSLDLKQIENEEKQYQINELNNDFNGYLKTKGQSLNHFSDDDFIKAFGDSPISLLNEVLEKYDCNGYEFHTTKIPRQLGIDYNLQNISLSLYHKRKGHITNLESLSSGEKTLLALAFFIYKLKSRRKVVASLLLLDEVDSSLHPSMSKRLINVLYDLFYVELGIKIIVSTHSPSTVAFAPDNSLYVMKSEGEDRLFASTKDGALDELTYGVPSFSINYENRRQIFVESKYDVEYYEKLYRIFKKSLNPDISLNFIASGDVQRDKNGGAKSNCDQVIKITKLLRDSGNKSIWGIIDWDSKTRRPENDHVRVLGWQDRYSIENFIFDPLMVSMLLMVEKIRLPDFFGLEVNFKIYEILDQNEDSLQKIINALLNALNSELQINLDDKISYTTTDGKKLNLPKKFMEFQGHSLEEKYLKVFPELNKLKRQDEKALKIEILNKVVEEYPELAPAGLLAILEEVQQV